MLRENKSKLEDAKKQVMNLLNSDGKEGQQSIKTKLKSVEEILSQVIDKNHEVFVDMKQSPNKKRKSDNNNEEEKSEKKTTHDIN